jgi:sporulation protein YlmC with PRC-barrel domain
MPTSKSDLDKNETPALIAADKVNGTTVYNTNAEEIGTIDKVMIDKRSGQVTYAVMSFGGFLGLGEDYRPVPWQALSYDTQKDGYVVQLTREQLEGAPHFDRDHEPDWEDKSFGSEVHDYYGFPPMGGAA